MNASSVHLRDLNNLVSAFSSNSHLGPHYAKDPSPSTRLHVLDDESSYEEDRRGVTTFSSKNYCPAISPLQSQSIIDRIQHGTFTKNNLLASEKESNGLHFGEQWNFNGKESNSLGLSSVRETDLSETQNGKNALHLISDLCDRLTTNDFSEKGKRSKATQTEMMDTPNDVASYVTPHSQTNMPVPLLVNKISKTLLESPYGSHSCTLSDSNISMPSYPNDTIENGFEDFLTQCHQVCGTFCEPAGAVSYLEDMIERIAPPLSCATPAVDESYKPNERDKENSNGLTNSSSGM